MRFQNKVFACTFAVTAVLLAGLALSVKSVLRDGLETEYLRHYDSVARIIADTLQRMESATSRISGANARLLSARLPGRLLPSEAELAELKRDLGVSQLVLAGADGRILRDTETPPEKRTATLFDFCDGYRGLLATPGRIETTPILPSYPSGRAYQFSMMARPTGAGAAGPAAIVEAGVHVGFIVDTLEQAIRSDGSIRAIGLYTPNGVALGSLTHDAKTAAEAVATTSLAPGIRRLGDDGLQIVTEVPASSQTCCECVKKRLTGPDGRYYYLLRTEVSLAPLRASLRALERRTLWLLAAALVLAFAGSRWTAAMLVRRLELFRERVDGVMSTGELTRRVAIAGRDEISNLAATFDRLAEQLDRTQKTAIEAEKNKALAAVARQVAHDIRSPLAALKAATHAAAEGAEHDPRLIRSAATRIQEIAENLLNRYRPGAAANSAADGTARTAGMPRAPESLALLIDGALAEKRAELSRNSRITFEFRPAPEAHALFTSVPGSELRRVLSNLLNNSVEAIAGDGKVLIALEGQGSVLRLSVIDDGKGIAADLLPRLLTPGGSSHGKAYGMGLGLGHARRTVESHGGRIVIRSEPGRGTCVELTLPAVAAPSWHVPELVVDPAQPVVIVDDQQSMHHLWRKRLRDLAAAAPIPATAGSGDPAAEAPRLVHCFGTEELEAQHAELRTAHPLYLVDQEITGSPETGLQIVARLGIAASAVLVTSHADDPAIVARCRELGLRLLPKVLAGQVPLRLRRRD